MQGKVCIVTGSSSGLGRAIAMRYAKEGAVVVCADLRPDAREEVPEERNANTDEIIRQEIGGKAKFVKTDVTKASEFASLVSNTVAEFGRLDV